MGDLLRTVVHIVVDRVEARLVRARIARSARVTGYSLRRRIINSVTKPIAAALEGMDKANPVAGFVDGSFTKIERWNAAARESIDINLTYISRSSRKERIARSAEGRTPVAFFDSIDENQIPSGRIALMQRSRHIVWIIAGRPHRIDFTICIL